MMPMASSSISSRTSIEGHRSPRMCSLSASPLPSPSPNRPLNSCWVVAAAWAMIARGMRMFGQTTAVVTRSLLVARAIAPSTLHTNGLWPCSGSQGWKDLLVLADLVGALPAPEREVIVLRFFQDLDQYEIAARVGFSQMHVSRLQRRALARMHGQLVEP